MKNKTYRYLALGDSYTIGEAVTERESFPYQLTALLKDHDVPVESVKIIAKTGWTTSDLIAAIESEETDHTYDFVTLLIGVNNQYQAKSKTQYREELQQLIFKSIAFVNGRKDRVFVLSIPDYGVTDFAKEKNLVLQISDDIDAYNNIVREEASREGVLFVDITPKSRLATSDQTLTASDTLHPSAKMYALWNEILLPNIVQTLSKSS
ncbi:SGNH/GDSL hydrolase family protein [Sphingobacterium sp. lm-10]|uniref:SGNH/GDSL hydrolase family protein n=1 Tax=Sphingobacterium sp. lm-10 TaxID=2944904 RepID=UPI00201FE2EC|nr:SGNH/GDSL hydrolase family protein [Sphingobacterium sp. lm-10]MCL7986435.1 SGNH/GDSL hydrolase family protein [Sphingobacterium sp. lm-10]